MIAFSTRRTQPIGLHLAGDTATLLQMEGSAEARTVRARARGAVPATDPASDESLREAGRSLKQLLSLDGFRGRQVVVSLPTSELFVHNVRLPNVPAEEFDRVVRWEAEERLPYPIDEAEVRHLHAGSVRQDNATRQEVILMACRRTCVQRLVRTLEHAQLVPVGIDVEPCAAVRALTEATFVADEEPKRRAYVDLGEDATSVAFAEGRRILFLKQVQWGGRGLDEAVARHLDLTLEEAARTRAVVTGAEELDPHDEVHRHVAEAIRDPLESVTSEIELCLRYYTVTFRGRPLEKVVLTGCESSRWLAEYLAERLRLPCETADPFVGRASSARPERPWQWSTAAGLSLKPCKT